MQKLKTQKGITLIALVITIIVMLILVGVSVTVALNGGLFTTAKEAAEGTASKRNEELELSSGKVEINGEWYNSIDEYVNGSGNGAGEQKVTITPKKESYTVGEEVTIGEESFYVIADDAENVTLLAKYNLNTAGTTQLNASHNETKVVFSSTNYWSSETEYPLNLNDYTIPEGETSAITTARAYGAAKGGTGRLMTKEEADTLVTNNEGIIYGTYDINGGLRYWLSYAENESEVWYMDGFMWDAYNAYYDAPLVYNGVRPVVEISKSNIS